METALEDLRGEAGSEDMYISSGSDIFLLFPVGERCRCTVPLEDDRPVVLRCTDPAEGKTGTSGTEQLGFRARLDDDAIEMMGCGWSAAGSLVMFVLA